MKVKNDPRCSDCRKHKAYTEGCSRVVCPERKQLTANYTPYAGGDVEAIVVTDGCFKKPTNTEGST